MRIKIETWSGACGFKKSSVAESYKKEEMNIIINKLSFTLLFGSLLDGDKFTQSHAGSVARISNLNGFSGLIIFLFDVVHLPDLLHQVLVLLLHQVLVLRILASELVYSQV